MYYMSVLVLWHSGRGGDDRRQQTGDASAAGSDDLNWPPTAGTNTGESWLSAAPEGELTAAAAPSKEDEEDSSGGGWTADGSSSSSAAAAAATGSRGEERLAASRALFSSHSLALHLQPETHIRRQATRHDCMSTP